MSLEDLQPSQLYISADKLAEVERQPLSDPVPVKRLGSWNVLTDGHTRAFAAWQEGRESVLACWEIDELDWEAYRICVEWCLEEGIDSVADLEGRVVTADRFEELWLRRCRAMHERLTEQREAGDGSGP